MQDSKCINPQRLSSDWSFSSERHNSNFCSLSHPPRRILVWRGGRNQWRIHYAFHNNDDNAGGKIFRKLLKFLNNFYSHYNWTIDSYTLGCSLFFSEQKKKFRSKRFWDILTLWTTILTNGLSGIRARVKHILGRGKILRNVTPWKFHNYNTVHQKTFIFDD